MQVPDWRDEARYGVYTVRRCAGCGGSGMVAAHQRLDGCAVCKGKGYSLVLVATADTPQAVGLALCTQGEDCHAAGVPAEAYGVLDGQAGRWLAQPPWGAR